MKKTALILATAMAASFASAGSIVDQFNEKEIGTLSGHLQGLSMYRDFENAPAEDYAHSTTLGIQLDYLSPEKEGWKVGASYVGVGVLDSKDYYDRPDPGGYLVGNSRVNVLNEAYLAYNMAALGWTNTTATVGRRVNNGEVFRADPFRQKSRALEAAMLETREFHKTRILVGHAWELSNWIDGGDQWKFENFDNWGTDGITWGEVVNNCIDDVEIALFNAYAEDLSNLLGARAKWNITDETALLGYYRNESDVGDSAERHSDVFGLSGVQKIDSITLEGGYFSVHGNTLRFQETTTGINHALGSSLMLYSGQFMGGADTLYAKATTKIEKTGTGLYALYHYTVHDKDKANLRQAQELNIVVKQPCPKFDNLTIAFKGGIGTRDGVNGTDNTTATDARLFVTYTF